MPRNAQIGDHLHDIAFEDHEFVPTTKFDYDAVDQALGLEPVPEMPVAFADMCAAFSLVLEWITEPKDAALIGGRALTLLYFLDSDISRFESLEAIAQHTGCTKQALSKALIGLRDGSGVGLTMGKPRYARE